MSHLRPLPEIERPDIGPTLFPRRHVPATANDPTMQHPSPPNFVFVTCQLGAEQAVKHEVATQWPDWRFAFSRSGFLTFKLPEDQAPPPPGFDLRSVFARTYGFCLGRVSADEPDSMAADVWRLADEANVTPDLRALHVWQRDTAVPGDHDFLPGPSELSEEIDQRLRQAAPTAVSDDVTGDVTDNAMDNAAGDTEASIATAKRSGPSATGPARRLASHAGTNHVVLDCIVVDPNEWWVGWHQATTVTSRWPGGVIPIDTPADAVSRAYLKMEESLRWSRLPVQDGDPCVEIGSAPGGSSQALLARGLVVNGVDPADMAPAVLAHPNFHHVRMRGSDLRRREFAGVRWLMADMNVAPKFTLDCVEPIVTHEDVHIRGILLTLKLPDWRLAAEVPALLDRIRSWGYRDVRACQLAFNRQEFVVAALQRRSQRRLLQRRGKQTRQPNRPPATHKRHT